MTDQIPAFDEHGNLPPGIYRVTAAQIEGRYDGQNLLQRRAITEKLLGFINFIRDFALLIYIDGSYVTENIEPGDAEILVLLPKNFDFDSYRGQELRRYQAQKMLNYLDIHPFVLEKESHRLTELLDGWTHSNDVAHRDKGILLMEFSNAQR